MEENQGRSLSEIAKEVAEMSDDQLRWNKLTDFLNICMQYAYASPDIMQCNRSYLAGFLAINTVSTLKGVSYRDKMMMINGIVNQVSQHTLEIMRRKAQNAKENTEGNRESTEGSTEGSIQEGQEIHSASVGADDE